MQVFYLGQDLLSLKDTTLYKTPECFLKSPYQKPFIILQDLPKVTLFSSPLKGRLLKKYLSQNHSHFCFKKWEDPLLLYKGSISPAWKDALLKTGGILRGVGFWPLELLPAPSLPTLFIIEKGPFPPTHVLKKGGNVFLTRLANNTPEEIKNTLSLAKEFYEPKEIQISPFTFEESTFLSFKKLSHPLLNTPFKRLIILSYVVKYQLTAIIMLAVLWGGTEFYKKDLERKITALTLPTKKAEKPYPIDPFVLEEVAKHLNHSQESIRGDEESYSQSMSSPNEAVSSSLPQQTSSPPQQILK